MHQPLNFFAPFSGIDAHHENQLTRALLVVLRYSPLAHMAWLNLVAPGEQLSSLPAPEMHTQKARPVNSRDGQEESDAIRGISVFLAPDAATLEIEVKPSDRTQILDGIIRYGSDLVIVIENKITSGAITVQPSQINTYGVPVRFEGPPRSLPWQTLLEVLADVVGRDLVSGAERLVISDFLDFAEHHFPHIGPYSTLLRCGAQPFRIKRRLDAVIALVAGEPVQANQGEGWRDLRDRQKVEMVFLGYETDHRHVILRLFPGDTLQQARWLYRDTTAVENLLGLQKSGWRIRPNFHWGFMASGYAWATGELPLENYAQYWVNNIATTREISTGEWSASWDALEDVGILGAGDRSEFDAAFTNTKRTKASPRPGLVCEFSWTFDDARALDSAGRFIDDVKTQANDVLSALGVLTL